MHHMFNIQLNRFSFSRFTGVNNLIKIDQRKPGSSRPEVFCKKGVLRNFTKFTGKHLCQRLFFNNVAGLRPATLLKKRRWHRCFHANFVSIFSYKTPLMASSIFCVHLICYIHRSKLLHSYYSQFHKRCCFHLLQLLDL